MSQSETHPLIVHSPLRRELRPMVKLALPIVLGEIGWISMNMVDTMMVGRLPSSAVAIGAVSLGSILFYLTAFFGMGMVLGLDTLVSQAFGAGRMDDAHKSLLNGAYLGLALAPVLMGITWLWGPLLEKFGIEPAVLRQTIPYLHALIWGMPSLILYFVFRRYLQGINRVNAVMLALLSANLVNLAGNWIFIYGHLGFRAMGVAGSGWATCVARTYLAAVLLADILYHDHRAKAGLRSAPRRPHVGRLHRLIGLGFPAAMQFTFEIGVFAVATALIAKIGAVPLAGHQVALNVVSFTYMVPLGISSAAAVRVGQALGRKDARGAAHAGWTAIAIGGTFMACAGVVLFLIPKFIMRIYTPNLAVIATGAPLLFVAAFFQLFDGIQAVTTGALRGMGDTRSPMLCHLVYYWAIGLPLGAWLCFRRGFGAAGLWTGFCLALILIGATLLLIWRRDIRRCMDAHHAATS